MQSIWRQKRWNHQETDHGKHKIHKRQLGNWDHGILPLESSSGWIRRAERCLWRGCGDRLSSSRSLVFNPLSQNTFQGMFWCYPGSQRRLCDSRDESVYKTDSILSILLTFFQVQINIFCSPGGAGLMSDQQGHLHGSFSCPYSFPFNFPSIHNWKSTPPGSVGNTEKE